MREFKFRVWDGEKYTIEPRLEVSLLNFPQTFSMVGFGRVIQQYTGLKDINGVEIYEGDIVKLTFPDSKILKKEYGHIYDVILKWEMEGLTFTGEVSGDFEEGILSHFSYYIKGIISFQKLKILTTSIEVIGNIFENKELLKDV